MVENGPLKRPIKRSMKYPPKKLGNGNTYRAIFWGGNVQKSAPSKAGFGGLRKWDWSGLCPFPPRKMTGHEQRGGGGNRIIGGGGSKTVFGKGFYGMVSPPLSFPPPLVFLRKKPCLHEFFPTIRANFGLFPCDTSQEPNGNCSRKNCSDEFFDLG